MTTTSIDRINDFFSPQKLQMETGVNSSSFFDVLIKELLDNAADAAEFDSSLKLQKNLLILQLRNYQIYRRKNR